MANVMSLKKLKNNPSRNGFDLSRKNIFSAKVGELLPVLTMECIPGDKFKINLKNFTRTQPVNTAAYTRMREYFDFFFVPSELIWHKYNTWVSQMVDNNQHASSISSVATLTDEMPYFALNDLVSVIENIQSQSSTGIHKNPLGFNRLKASLKLLNYLNYGHYRSDDGNSINIRPTENLKLNPFPLFAYQKIYADYYRNTQWEKSHAPAFNMDYITGNGDLQLDVAHVDQHYGQFFDLRYANFNKDYFMGLLPNSQFGDAASISLSSLGDTSDFSMLQSFAEGGSNVGFNWPASLGTTQSVELYNPYGKRFVLSTPSNASYNPSSPIGLYLSQQDVANLRASLNLGTVSSFTILALRQAEALQKWREITQSQNKDYKSQMEAHFGVTLDDAYSDRCQFIGGIVNTIDINEVVNTNITSNNAADIAGKGIGVGDGNISFQTDVHGILMCVYHCKPLLDYSISGLDKLNTKTLVTDYAIPELDATGMVLMPYIELVSDNIDTKFTNLLGYAPRYYDYKTSYDRIHGAFVDGGLDAWTAPITTAYLRKVLNDSTGAISLKWPAFQISPSIVDTIFSVAADDDVSSDQLLVNSSFDIKAVRNLDYNGLPY